MDTKIVEIDINNINEKYIDEAGEIIRAGGLVAFPTETVYGLGGDGLNKSSSKKIYEAKGRPSDNPLIVHIAELGAIEKITKNVPDNAYKLAEVFCPGPLTMILEKSDIVPYETTGGLDTVGVRMPDNAIALEFIEKSGGYIAAPSANLSGRPSPTSAKHVIDDLSGRIDMIIDGGTSKIGLESTIVDLTGDIPTILRPGYISIKDLSKVVGDVVYDRAIFDKDSDAAPKAPGMKYRHYAPRGDLSIVTGDKDKVISYIKEHTREALDNGERVGIIAADETYFNYSATVVKNIGSENDEETIARQLYAVLREFDADNITKIYSEEFNAQDIGQAIMNRLIKAAGYKIINA